MLICFDNPITNLQFSFVLFWEDLSHYKWGRVISSIRWNKWNISDLEPDIDADSGTDDDEYGDPETN